MSTHKYIDRICCAALIISLLLTVGYMNAEALGIEPASGSAGYETRLFDTSAVHKIDIVMDDWDDFLETCTEEEYVSCTVIIDNEAYKNVAIRAKGNTSLTQVASYGNDRYSFKIEFDHYDSAKSYYGLDKLSLNNLIQDNTYMKDYLTYQMMGFFGVDAPLSSYAQIFVNGEEWGLYLAVEGVEDAFLTRNYGGDAGELYKPDSQDLGGGRGNGGGFEMAEWPPGGNENRPEAADPEEDPGMGKTGAGSSDVSLIYTDDEYDSYAHIFDNAKTDITDADKDRLIASLKQLNENEDIESVVDVEKVIRYFVVHNFVCNFDSYTGSMIHNYYLYEGDGQLSLIPWDYNLAFGGFMGGSDAGTLVNYPIDSPVYGGTVDSRPMLSWIFASEEYTELYHQYFSEFISEYFDSGYFAGMIDAAETLIRPYVESDPTKFCTYEEFEAGVDTLREFCLLRAESVKGQLAGTIPSDSDGQPDSSAWIDASELLISDMGTMNNGLSAGTGGMPEQGQMPPDSSGMSEPGEEPPDISGGQENDLQNKDRGPMPPDETLENRPAGSEPGDPQTAASGGQEALLGVSAAVLLGALALAAFYKKRC
jgi:spore coat protein CotH